jgi:hypothetical protein
MIRSDLWLSASALLLTLLHAGYSVLERQRPDASYFSRGMVLLESGKSLTQNARLQFRNNMIYDYQQIDNLSRMLPLKIENSLWGNFNLTTTPTNRSLDRPTKEYANSQLAYNQVYYSNENMPLTFYRLPTEPDSFCTYIIELQKLRCFGITQ